ncbi:MAG: YihA family ribosome biogenesis GTP-binding protein [Alphaproteobacteria bacterium]|nr:YihA family ribosome biogenesis GTP-binding protein [Alphaproteobacteria bacterium]
MDEDAIERGRLLFARECRFVTGAAGLDDLPAADLPEVAFAGRSNVGKSSLLNALTGRKNLARTSNTPGRTRQLNFFDLGGELMLADLPGYGYARASRSEVRSWTRLTMDYLRGRPTLRRVFLLIDARHGLMPTDNEILDLFDNAAVAYQAVLTKADKTKPAELSDRLTEIARSLAKHPAAHPEVIATSAVRKTGIAELRAWLATLDDTESLS